MNTIIFDSFSLILGYTSFQYSFRYSTNYK